MSENGDENAVKFLKKHSGNNVLKNNLVQWIYFDMIIQKCFMTVLSL